MTELGDDLRAAVRRHVEGFWSDRPQEEFSWELGPIRDVLPGFRVRRIAPTGRSEPWVYVTVGASVASETDRTEFLLLSPTESPRHVETLAMVAHFNADERYRLSLGGTLRIGRPWIEGSSADWLLVSLPYPYGPGLEHLDTKHGQVRLLWLVPITEAEAAFAREKGIEALEDLLEGSEVDVIAPNRRSLV